MMPEANPFAAGLRAGLLTVLALAAGCTTTARSPEGQATAQAASPRGESEALAAAQNALQAGDCRKATESYLAAARLSADPVTAMRASQLALGCENLAAARTATARWRELDPWSGDAALAAALVAMKRYDMDESREALGAWRDSGSGGNQDPLSFAEGLSEEADATLLYRVFDEVLVGEDPAAEVLLAQARLAMGAYNMRAALDAARQALELESGMVEAQLIVVRALSVLGEHDAAIASLAQLPREVLEGDDALLYADLLMAAGRDADAESELQSRAEDPQTAPGAYRRMVSVALRNGQLEQAEQHLEALVNSGGNAALAVLYLAEIAERRGNIPRAIQSYQMLAESPLALNARTSAARLLMKEGAVAQGAQLIDEYDPANLKEALQAGLTRAQLLAEVGELKEALAGLDALAKQYPEHPDVDYTRATVLETGGRTRDAVAQFERALKKRPDDPQLLNALGYTLADHKQRLGEAEQMVRRSLEISPDNPAILDSMGWVMYRRGKLDEAQRLLERAWVNSHDTEIGSHYGEVLWKAGQESQARYVWQQALNAAPGHDALKKTISRLTGEEVDAG